MADTPDLTELDRVIADDPRRTSKVSTICGVARAKQENPDQVGLIDAAVAHEAGSRAVSVFLRDRGIDVSQGSLMRHRREVCRCGK